MRNKYRIERELEEAEMHFQEWAVYKLSNEPFNPLQAKTQKYSEPLGGGVSTSIVPHRSIDAERHSVPLIESLMKVWPDPMADAVRYFYLEGAKLSKGERQKAWSEKYHTNRHMYEAYLLCAKWVVWAELNPIRLRV